MCTFILLIHVNEKKLFSDAFIAKTTSGLNNSPFAKRKRNNSCPKAAAFTPTIKLFCGYCVCRHTILTDTYSLKDCRSDPVNQISITDTQAYKSNIYWQWNMEKFILKPFFGVHNLSLTNIKANVHADTEYFPMWQVWRPTAMLSVCNVTSTFNYQCWINHPTKIY